MNWFKNLFKHNCQNNKQWISFEYSKCGMTGIKYGLIINFRCKYCGKEWSE